MSYEVFEVARFQEGETVQRVFNVKDSSGTLVSPTGYTYELELAIEDSPGYDDQTTECTEAPTGVITFKKSDLGRGLYRERFTAIASGISYVVEGRFRVG